MRGFVIAACLAASACGFQLRGDSPAGLKSLHVTTDAPSGVALEIRRQLSGGPARLAPAPGEAQAHLRILSEGTEKSIQTLTGTGRVFDYALRLRVGYQVTGAGERALIEPAQIEVRRIVSYSETAPLAKEIEERQLFEDMRAEAASQILRRISVVLAGAAPK